VVREYAAPQVLRNGGDGSFTPVDALAAFLAVSAADWGDFDNDGDGDLVLIDADTGNLLVSWNDRAGAFNAPVAIAEEAVAAMAYGDLAGDGRMRPVVLGRYGGVRLLSFDPV